MLGLSLCSPFKVQSVTIGVGSGSYTTTFPGVDSAGRNGLPGGSPQLSGAAVGKPVPTNDWWSALLNQDHPGNLFNYPLAMGTLPGGLDIGYLNPVSGPNGSSEPRDPFDTIVVGVEGLNATRATVHDYSDWTVTIAWNSSGKFFRATSGIGMPFVYFQKGATDIAEVVVSEGTPAVLGEILLISNSQGGADFAVYAPEGSSWIQNGNSFTSSLNGKNYWSIAILPEGDPQSLAAAWQPHAFVEPVNTEVSWNYEESSAILRTEFTTTVQIHEGSGTSVIQGLLPHQWSRLASDAPNLTGTSLNSIRGELKLIASNTFATEREFQGILPTLPALGINSESFNPATLSEKVNALKGESLSTWTDSYNEGQVMNRLIQTARIAHETGDFEARDQMIATVKERLEDWLTYESGEVAFLFHYSDTWTALFGYPGGHGQDTNINDHHFHWGYFIHAAAFMEQFEPGWADQWGPMVDLLVRDAASPDRADPLFPFLRNFSPFAGHAWANGLATFPFGNDQESTSESMQFNSSLIHWGALTGNEEIRDLGIYLYTTEQTAVEEYWFDINDRTFKPGYGFSLASRIWGNGYDNQTFWTTDIAAAYGIEFYPIHGGSLYLGENGSYARDLWNEIESNTGILNQAVNPNLWHDVYWQFLAFTDPQLALQLYEGNPNRELKFGVSDAQTYYWLHSMNALGEVDASVTANDPLAAVFSKNGLKTYVAHNYSDQARTVEFSDGATLLVPPNEMVTSQDPPFSGSLSTPFPVAPVGGTVPLTVTVDGDSQSLNSVEVYNGTQLIATLTGEPYAFHTSALNAGRHTFYARLIGAEATSFTGLTTVSAGEQVPFGGVPVELPGQLEAGSYDRYEGGSGQGFAYFDASPGNAGGFRPNEDVDATEVNGEGATIGWVDSGEWLEYTVEVVESGIYSLSIRVACDLDAGAGPFHFELNGERISPDFSVASTGGWDSFQTASFEGIQLPAGRQVLRLQVTSGQFNFGRMTFSRSGPLGYQPPVADAGNDLVVDPAVGSTVLNASSSSVESGKTLSAEWKQIFGPEVATISSPSSVQTAVSGLDREGIYRFEVTVTDGTRIDTDQIDLVVGELSALPPSALILSPSNGAQVIAGKPLTVSTIANDSDGAVERVDLFNGSIHLGTLFEEPYEFKWSPPVGSHSLSLVVLDSDGLTGTSTPVNLTANPPAPCRTASASGDFEVEFSTDMENPTVTFIPSRAGVGSGIVIFYPGQGGVIIQPNVPYQFNAAEGQTISYYFTYSVPEGGERNTIAENATFTVGACAQEINTDLDLAWIDWLETYFTEEELNNPSLEATLWGHEADPDADFIPNFVEFNTGGHPGEISPMPLHVVPYSTSEEIKVRYSRLSGFPANPVSLQWSTDLQSWSASGITTAEVSLENGLELLEATYSPANPNEGTVYFRVHAQPVP